MFIRLPNLAYSSQETINYNYFCLAERYKFARHFDELTLQQISAVKHLTNFLPVLPQNNF